MPDTRLFRALALTFALAVPAILNAQPQTTVPQTTVPQTTVPQTTAAPALSDQEARAAANQQQADAARLQLEANVANQQAVAAAEKARADNALALAAYEAEKARLAKEYAAKMAEWNARYATCNQHKNTNCVVRQAPAPKP